MTNDKRSLMVIPARGGSKRLPRKNILDLAGKPLIAHTIEAAIGADCFSEVLVSTDDPEIRDCASKFDQVLIDDRAIDLAGDKVKVVDVIHEICSRQDIQDRFNVIGMMLPTAPFRRRNDIQSGLKKLDNEVDSVVSFAPYEFPPQMAVTLDEKSGRMTPIFEPSPLITGNTRSQDQAAAYRPNGSFYLCWLPAFIMHKSFFRGRVRGIAMSAFGSIDIDTIDDLRLARLIIEAGLAESDFA